MTANCHVNDGINPLLKQNRYKYLFFKVGVFNDSQRNLILIIIIIIIIIEHSIDSLQKASCTWNITHNTESTAV